MFRPLCSWHTLNTRILGCIFKGLQFYPHITVFSWMTFSTILMFELMCLLPWFPSHKLTRPKANLFQSTWTFPWCQLSDICYLLDVLCASLLTSYNAYSSRLSLSDIAKIVSILCNSQDPMSKLPRPHVGGIYSMHATGNQLRKIKDIQTIKF